MSGTVSGEAPARHVTYDNLILLSLTTQELYSSAVWKVVVDLVEEWLNNLPQADYDQIFAALELLQDQGPTLGRPLVDTVEGSRYKNMKELRPGSSGRSEIRVLFAFDPERCAILLVAGDKAQRWNKWYQHNIPRADDLFATHLRSLKGDMK